MSHLIEGEYHIRWLNGPISSMLNHAIIAIKEVSRDYQSLPQQAIINKKPEILSHELNKTSCDNFTVFDEEYNNHYILQWNLGDWYHDTILSILAYKTIKSGHDFISLMNIIAYCNSKFIMSYP